MFLLEFIFVNFSMTNKLVGKKIIPRKNVFSTKQDLSAKLTLTNMQLRNLILNLHNTLIFTIGRQKKTVDCNCYFKFYGYFN